MSNANHPLMEGNVNREDIDALVSFLQQDPIPQLTNGPKVKEFEKKWGSWLGTDRNTMVNSGSMANELTLLALKYLYPKGGEVILTPLGWVSDVAAVLHAGFTPVFCDINLRTLSVDVESFKKKITSKTKALLLVHILGLNGFGKSDEIIRICKEKNIKLIEDVCESHGATFQGKKLGSFGDISNFSFFFAHHLCSLAEGGMICTNDMEMDELVKVFRSHGMVRECPNEGFRDKIIRENPLLNKDFIFLGASHNGRSQEVNAVVALNQLKRLDKNNKKRSENFQYFIDNLDSNKYFTDFEMEGQCNYALIVVLKEKSFEFRDKVEAILKEKGIEFRRGLSGGGNQMKQPYLKGIVKEKEEDFPNVNHVHHFGWYIGNYPTLKKSKIKNLLKVLNGIE